MSTIEPGNMIYINQDDCFCRVHSIHIDTVTLCYPDGSYRKISMTDLEKAMYKEAVKECEE